jgi:hypothetical protein
MEMGDRREVEFGGYLLYVRKKKAMAIMEGR